MSLKDILGKIPYAADLYDAIRPVRPRTRYNLSQLEKALPAAVEQVKNGLDSGLYRGLTDGNGTGNGLSNGLTDGNGPGNGLYRGLTDGNGTDSGLSNGLTDGNGRGNGLYRGLTDGNGRGNGLSNGLTDGNGRGNGLSNGLTDGNGPDSGLYRGLTDGNGRGRRIVLFATLHYWVEQAAIIGLALRGMGHDVTIAYLPYGDWDKEINAFDLRRQDLYTRRVLKPLKGLVKVVSLFDVIASERSSASVVISSRQANSLKQGIASGLDTPLADAHGYSTLAMTPELEKAIETASAFDTMYTLQVEDFDRESDLYRLRVARNRQAALAALRFLSESRPETVLVPNGLVTELGIFYQVARHLDLMTVTYEFNDQREQIWLAQNDIVMRQNTDALWAAKGHIPLTDAEREKIAALEDARTSAKKYGKGTRFWQDVASVGGEKLRADLGLDSRPVVLLATNVLGDSLTLGRNIFTASMAEWIEKTVQYFAGRPDVQLVVRVHPGERLMKGPSMVGVIERAVPNRPEHIHVIGPNEKVNTYDLMEIASLGLAYTTTVGMEMAMRGVPVIVAGQTHYRGRGFTYDPMTYDEYFGMLGSLLSGSSVSRLSEKQVEAAWNYAYRFFFDFPIDFPWRLMHFWKDYEIWPLARVLSDEGHAAFGKAFDYLAGEPVQW